MRRRLDPPMCAGPHKGHAQVISECLPDGCGSRRVLGVCRQGEGQSRGHDHEPQDKSCDDDHVLCHRDGLHADLKRNGAVGDWIAERPREVLHPCDARRSRCSTAVWRDVVTVVVARLALRQCRQPDQGDGDGSSENQYRPTDYGCTNVTPSAGSDRPFGVPQAESATDRQHRGARVSDASTATERPMALGIPAELK